MRIKTERITLTIKVEIDPDLEGNPPTGTESVTIVVTEGMLRSADLSDLVGRLLRSARSKGAA